MADQGTVFLPLVSSSTLDIYGLKQLWGSGVLASCLITREDADPFFNPTTRFHTGFAYNGNRYTDGVLDTNEGTPIQSGWITESPGVYRGYGPFPSRGLVLVTDVGLEILSIETDKLTTWMTFLRGDFLAFSHNVAGESSYTPREVVYNKGVIYITQIPDNGSKIRSTMVNVIDFSKDTVSARLSPAFR